MLSEYIKNFTTSWLLTLFLISGRMIPIIMQLPAFGENFISSRVKLMISLFISMIIMPIIFNNNPPKLENITINLVNEVVIGVAIGLVIKAIMSTISMAGHVISHHSGLASAQIFDPLKSEQGSVEGGLLNMLLIMLIIVTNTHHLFISAILESYKYYPIFQPINLEQNSNMFADLLNSLFITAVKISAPYMIVITMFFIACGVISKVMPNIQIFFITLPIQIIISFVILYLTFPFAIWWFIDQIALLLHKYLF